MKTVFPGKHTNASMKKLSHSNFPTLKFFILFIIPKIALSDSLLSFNYTAFDHDTSGFFLEGNAVILNGFLDLTNGTLNPNATYSVGRATYAEPLRLHDDRGRHASFSTHFSFIIDSQNRTPYADGFAFFVAPETTTLPIPNRDGCNLGLMSSEKQMNQTAGSFVAVEFDMYKNEWDPEGSHVGIDLNSLRSITLAEWSSGILQGRKAEAWIQYNASTNSLDVKFSNFTSKTDTVEYGSLQYTVNLSQMLSERVRFGFSASTGTFTEVHKIISWDFTATFPRGKENDESNDDKQSADSGSLRKEKRKIYSKLALWLSVGSIVIVIITVVVAWMSLWRKRRGQDDKFGFEFSYSMEGAFGKAAGPRKFSYAEMAQATNGFEEKGKLGKGGFGCVYKGYLKDKDSYVAVKKVSKGSKQGLKEYASEVRIISQLRHKNLVKLVGWCHEKGELLLVYEYMPNGSLDSQLFKGSGSISWDTRYEIARGLASALLYLHESGDRCVLHRDIKSSNIMLDSGFNAKLGDFGLARLVDHRKGSRTTVLAGTIGYMAPECLISGMASKESDVYSFGVVALEIACGRRSVEPRYEEEQLVHWVWELYGSGKLLEAADPNLQGEYKRDEMECLMMVGLWCVHPDSALRPSIREAIRVLNFESSVPEIPLLMPVLRYVTPTLDIKELQNMSFSITNNTCSRGLGQKDLEQRDGVFS